MATYVCSKCGASFESKAKKQPKCVLCKACKPRLEKGKKPPKKPGGG